MIHRAAFDRAGLDWAYEAFEVAPGHGADAVAAMRVLGIIGLSVTMPHKQAVAAAVDRLDPAAAALGGVNTVSWHGDELVGTSTDGDGLIDSLVDHDVGLDGARVVVFGAGGAARSVIDALGRSPVADIAVVNRSRERAESAVELAGAARVGSAADVSTADVVVNATSVGMGVAVGVAAAGDLPCDLATLREGAVVADLVYQPLETAWLARAREVGAPTVDGLGMLVHQAARQQVVWTGARPDVTAMRAAAERELARRNDPAAGVAG